jgi:hypothetical protein
MNGTRVDGTDRLPAVASAPPQEKFRRIVKAGFMKKIFSLSIFISFLLVVSPLFSLEMTTIVDYNEQDMYAKYFDSVSPAQIFRDVSQHLPNAQ